MAGLPPALSKFYPSVAIPAQDVAASVPSAAAAAASRVAATEHRRSLLTWAMPLALAALAVWAIVGLFDRRAPEQARNESMPRAVGTSGFVKTELPDGVNLRFRPTGTEARLLAFIRGSGSPARVTWFEFDRLNFETGSPVLKSDSTEQLSNIAAILKAYPAATVKIGGYTDNTGDAAANVRLSQMRAEAVRDQLQAMGIDASRLAAEGYGGQHPVADNNTAEGRAQNRRVAIRVTAK
jgi:OmpA-OmpF porin, OOP family